jgi:hypothetical protein
MDSTRTLNATLPMEYSDRSLVKEMLPGDFGWVEPWAMAADRDRALWLGGEFPVYPKQWSTVSMWVRRGLDGGFEVDIRETEYKWRILDLVLPGAWLPVVRLCGTVLG